MRYMGGKCLVSNEIALIINTYTWGGQDEENTTLHHLLQ